MSILEIACDEAGYTGPDLLNEDQRYFTFGSVAVGDEEAWEIINGAVTRHNVKMPELKAPRLMKTARGRAVVSDIIDTLEGRYATTIVHKLLALGGWVFEYIIEPVYQHRPELLYEKNLHRFVAMQGWLWFQDPDDRAVEALRQFQAYMRSRDKTKAPLFFNQDWPPLGSGAEEHPFDLILRFAHGYQHIICPDNVRLEDELSEGGKWTLDLSASGLWSHMNRWGQTGKMLQVRCDSSKPIRSIVGKFTGDDDDPAVIRARQMFGNQPVGFNLERPVELVDSRAHPSVQLADLVAGTLLFIVARGAPDGFEKVSESLQRHCLPDSIMPDYEVINLEERGPSVNYAILYDLAKRAENQSDPHAGLAEMYHYAEAFYDSGGFTQ